MRPRDTGLPHPADGCPRCIGGPANVPYRVEDASNDTAEGVRCWYRCPRCLHSWWCSWMTTGMSPGDLHYHPDAHNGRECPCGCGTQLLRPPHQTDYGTEVA